MAANVPPTTLPKPPLGIIDSITSGFEVVNGRLVLAALPLALDLFLWLGPKLSIKPLVPPVLSGLEFLYNYGGDQATAQGFDQVRAWLTQFGNQYNVFSALSTPALGLPSFMVDRMPDAVPAGLSSMVVPVNSPFVYVALWTLFTVGGLFLAALYFGSIAQQVSAKRLDLLKLARQVWVDWVRLTLFAVLATAVLAVVMLPLMMIGGVMIQLVPLLGALVSALAFTFAMWLIFYLVFTVQGIVLARRGLFSALFDSLRLVHGSLPATAGLYGLVLIINWGLNVLWNLAPAASWVMLAALGGHALVATALVAATFVFYQDRVRWWQEMRAARAAGLLSGARPPLRRTR